MTAPTDKNGAAQQRAALLHRLASRKQPLPAGVTLVRLANRVAALCVDGAVHGADISVQVQCDGPWLRFPVRSARRLPRGRTVWVKVEGQGSYALFPYPPGMMGMADVGSPDQAEHADSGYSDPVLDTVDAVHALFDIGGHKSSAAARSSSRWRAEQLVQQLRAALGVRS